MHTEVKNLYRHYLLAKVFDAPLWTMIAYLPFIMAKELHSPQSQITLAMTLKPLLALGSFHLGARAARGLANLGHHILWISFFGRIPLLLFPFIQDGWYYLLGFALYALTDRAVIPSWMELLKIHTQHGTQTKAVADGALVRFLTPLLLSLGLGVWMDAQEVWRWLFAGAAILSLMGLIPLMRYPLDRKNRSTLRPTRMRDAFFDPWKAFFHLLKTRRDFAFFQGIFFLGGMGIMMYHPLLPNYCADHLNMDYKQLGLALAVCKGIGFALTGRLWARLIQRTNLFSLAAIVALCACLTPLLIGLADVSLYLFYAAYLVYGVMQAGSEPIWHLSGPLFAGTQNSGPYTNVNVLLVGVRGLFAPTLGAFLGHLFGLKAALAIASIVCLCGCGWGFLGYYRYQVPLLSRSVRQET